MVWTDDSTLIVRYWPCPYGRDLKDAWWFKKKFPLGKGGEWERDDDITYYVKTEGMYVRLAAWDSISRVVFYRESIYIGHWCDCHWWYYLEVHMAKFVAAARKVQTSTKRGAEAQCKVLEKRCPAIHEFLTLTVLDGKPRDVSTFSIFTEGGRWKAALADKDAECSLYVTADSPDALWDAMESELTGEAPDWRAWRSQGKQKGKK